MRRAWVLLGLAACTPELGAPPSLVSATRVLAVRGEPAEVAPGETARFRPLVVTPDGTVQAGIYWAFCLAPRPLGQGNIVSDACLGGEPGDIADIGAGVTETSAALPAQACALFGPDSPPAKPGSPPLRARDADVTGGYYQPVRAELPGAGAGGAPLVAFGLERIRCNLANATIDVAQEYRRRYTPNQNPALEAVTGGVGDAAALPLQAEGTPGGEGTLSSVAPGQPVQLTARWSAGSAETYPVLDLTTHALVDHRETLRVSWFASAGTFTHDRTGRDETEAATETTTDNTWTAPPATGDVHLWAVLRDSRGGVDWRAFVVRVQ